jgi:hypothetical protein
MPKSNLRIVPPATENGTVLAMQPPRRPPNRELREREHLTDAEVEQLVEAARGNRYGTRGCADGAARSLPSAPRHQSSETLAARLRLDPSSAGKFEHLKFKDLCCQSQGTCTGKA